MPEKENMIDIDKEIKVHETIGKKSYTQKNQWIIHVVNLTEIPLNAEIIHDIDEFKVFITKKDMGNKIISKTNKRITQAIVDFITKNIRNIGDYSDKQILDFVSNNKDIKRLDKYDARVQLSLESHPVVFPDPKTFYKIFHKDIVDIHLERD
jgi:hypothetical protein